MGRMLSLKFAFLVIYTISWLVTHLIVVVWIVNHLKSYKIVSGAIIAGLNWIHSNFLVPLLGLFFGKYVVNLFDSSMYGNYHAGMVIYPVLIGIISYLIFQFLSIFRRKG